MRSAAGRRKRYEFIRTILDEIAAREIHTGAQRFVVRKKSSIIDRLTERVKDSDMWSASALWRDDDFIGAVSGKVTAYDVHSHAQRWVKGEEASNLATVQAQDADARFKPHPIPYDDFRNTVISQVRKGDARPRNGICVF